MPFLRLFEIKTMRDVRNFLLMLFLLNGFFSFNAYGTTAISIAEILCDYKENPLGVSEHPKFSWKLSSDLRKRFQSAYKILLADNSEMLKKNKGNFWDSGKIVSDQSLHVAYKGKTLQPGKTYFWKVKVWDQDGNESVWSSQETFVTALFNEKDWNGAQWIQFENMPDSLILTPGVHPWGKNVKHLATRKPAIPMFRKEFSSDKKIKHANLFISGLGHYKAYINGNQVSDDFLSPGWTQYTQQCLYNIYDVKDHLTKGKNAMGVIVGSGFYNIHNERYRKMLLTYGMPKLITMLKIVYEDGTEQKIVSGTDWKASPSPFTFSTIYGGETYDATLEQPGWNKPGFTAVNWQNAILARHPGGMLQHQTSYPIKVMETFSPIKVEKVDSINYLYDFGQNASGIVSIKVKGKKGQKIKLIPGELITDKNYVNQKATGSPYSWEYILKGDGEEVWQPHFTYYGFRYVQVEGGTPKGQTEGDKPEILDIKSLHTYNSAPHAGEFSTSNDLFNRINKLIRYAMQSNFQSVLTDCPHREKLGWLEQTHLMGRSMYYNFELYHLYSKQVRDMMDSQTENGMIPAIAPEYVKFDGDFRDSPEWGSAGIILPYLMYQWYGEKSVMEEAWLMMVKYLDYLKSRSEGHIVSHGLGDWYDLGPNRPGYAQLTPVKLTATATYYYDVVLMSQMAELVGKPEDAKYYQNLADQIKQAFNDTFYNPEKKVYATGSQTAMAMPLCLGLVDERDRQQVLKNLTDSIKANGKALTAGDVGFHYLVEALTEGGVSRLFYEMNNRDDVPGYGFQLRKGATALTESWQALESVSNNHLMLGHIMEWFYKGLGGIRQEPGSIAYKNIMIKPDMIGDITFASTSYTSAYGQIKSHWQKKSDGTIEMEVIIPVNTTASIYLPANNIDKVTEGGKKLKDIKDIEVTGDSKDSVVVKAGSGRYRFVVVNSEK